jgi:RecA-family ATPase
MKNPQVRTEQKQACWQGHIQSWEQSGRSQEAYYKAQPHNPSHSRHSILATKTQTFIGDTYRYYTWMTFFIKLH